MESGRRRAAVEGEGACARAALPGRCAAGRGRLEARSALSRRRRRGAQAAKPSTACWMYMQPREEGCEKELAPHGGAAHAGLHAPHSVRWL